MDNKKKLFAKSGKIVWVIFFIVLFYYLFRFSVLTGIAGIVIFSAVMIFVKRINLYIFQGNSKYKKGDLDGAIKSFSKAVTMKGCIPAIKLIYAYLLLKDGKLDEAEDMIKIVLEDEDISEEDHNIANSHLSIVLWKRGEIEEAVKLMEDVFEKSPTTDNYGTLGYYYILLKDMEKVLKFNLEAYEYNEMNSIIADNLGQTYYLLGDYDKSKEVYEKMFEKKVTFPEAHYNYGLLLIELGEKEKAREYLDEANKFILTFLSTISKEDIDRAIEKAGEL